MGEARLIMPDGVEIVDEKDVQKKITELLPVSPATLQTLLLARRSELHQTMKNIKNEGEVRKELGDLLRKSLMETGGVSVDRFRDELESRDRKSTRLNSSHVAISYAVFCL